MTPEERLKEIKIIQKEINQLNNLINKSENKVERLENKVYRLENPGESTYSRCPKCKHKIEELYSGVKCSNPKCDYWYCA